MRIVDGEMLNDNKAIVLRAKCNFVDIYNIPRVAGEK